ncbi:glutathione S-transferase, partial [Diplocarpon rosae]
SKLEDLYPPCPSHPALSSSEPSDQGLSQLLSIWTIETLFTKAAALIPSDMPLAKDARFRKDREDFSGRSWDEADRERRRREALVDVRDAFELLETRILADGREWVLGGEGPSLGDIEVWLFHWLTTLHGALPPDLISPIHFPKVFSWISRFQSCPLSPPSRNRAPSTGTKRYTPHI